MSTREVLTAAELAELISSTPGGIRNQLYHGKDGINIPPSFKIGGKRRWLREQVIAWLREKAGFPEQRSDEKGGFVPELRRVKSGAQPVSPPLKKTRGRPRKTQQPSPRSAGARARAATLSAKSSDQEA
jgi:hypothetical protein